MRIVLVLYLAATILFAAWSDAVDARCAKQRESFLMTLLISVTWPMSLPIAMYVLTDNGGRWSLCKRGQSA